MRKREDFGTLEEYYKYCTKKYFRKPPAEDKAFILEEGTDGIHEIKLGIWVSVTESGYILQCIFNDDYIFSVSDSSFDTAVSKFFSTEEFCGIISLVNSQLR